MQSFLDNLVGDVRAIEVGGVNMVYARRDRLPKDGESSVRVLGRTINTRAGELHRAVTHPLNSDGRAGERERAPEFSFIRCAACFHIQPFVLCVNCFFSECLLHFILLFLVPLRDFLNAWNY